MIVTQATILETEMWGEIGFLVTLYKYYKLCWNQKKKDATCEDKRIV